MPESPFNQAIHFSVAGKARPKGRARTSAKNGVRRHYTPKATSDYEGAIRVAATDALAARPMFNGPVSVTVTVRCKPPQRTSKKAMAEMLDGRLMPTTRPDIDNILKAVGDGISKTVIRDDADIVHFVGAKRYAAEAGIDVIVEPFRKTNSRSEVPTDGSVMDALEVIGAVWRAERVAISPDMVRRVIHLLAELVDDETRKGHRVEVELLGVFSKSPSGQLLFDEERGRDWPSLQSHIEWIPEDLAVGGL